jgi:hypothetical protein
LTLKKHGVIVDVVGERLSNQRGLRMTEKKWITAQEMSKELGIPARSCQRYLKDNTHGLFPSARKARPLRNSKYVVLLSEVEAAKSQFPKFDEDF